MAKKARKLLETKEEFEQFQFPKFDEGKFILYELEQSSATLFSIALAVLVALATWQLTLYGLGQGAGTIFGAISVVIGIGVGILLPFLIRAVRELSATYKKGDWAMLIILYLFLWLGLWTILLNV